MSSEDENAELQKGSEMLMRISNEMVRAQKRFFGKGPEKARSYIFDDMLIIVMRGGMTTAEHTMVEFGREDEVRTFRQVFENEMTERLTDMVEEVTGRKVLTYQSQIMFHPDVVIELFVFDKPATYEARAATSQGQLNDAGTGEATDQDALDTPSEQGQE